MKIKEEEESNNNNNINHIDSLRPVLLSLMKGSYSNHVSDTDKHSKFFEEVGIQIVEHTLKLSGYKIIETSPSSYPEVEFTDGKKLYAIDMKTARSCADPQFDLCYISLYPEMNYDKYDEEWVFIIKYDKDKEPIDSLLDCYFEKLHNVASLQKTGDLAGKVLSKGGAAIKSRPISWSKLSDRDFEISDRDSFLEYLIKTQDVVREDVKKAKVMKKQLDKFHNIGIGKPDLKTENGVAQWIFKHNLDLSVIKRTLEDISNEQ